MKSQIAGCARKKRSNSPIIFSSEYSPTSEQALTTDSPVIIDFPILAQHVHPRKRVVMRRLAGLLIPLAVCSAALLFSQEFAYVLEGRYGVHSAVQCYHPRHGLGPDPAEHRRVLPRNGSGRLRK